MLCLTHKKLGILRINDDISVTALDIWGNQVRLGISAPENVNIVREELIDRENEAHKPEAESTSALGPSRPVTEDAIDSTKHPPRIIYKRQGRRLTPDPA
jgi:carbon storage regulator